MAKLNTTIPVRDPEGKLVVLEAGKTVPKWAEELITTPGVWAKDDDDNGAGDDSEKSAIVTELTVSRDDLYDAFVLAEESGLSLDEAEALVAAVLEIFNLDLPARLGDAESTEATSGEPNDEALVIPPKSGAGSGVEAWAAYAKAAVDRAGLKIAFEPDATRGDIIEALETAKIATEAPKGS